MQLRAQGNGLGIDATDYAQWIATAEPSHIAARTAAAWADCRERTPTISILLPTYDTDAHFLRAALDSVLAQVYPHWQLCIVDDASSRPHVRALLEAYAARDARIAVHFEPHNRGIAASTNRALRMAGGEYVALLDHDDVLSADALLCIAAAASRNPQAQLLYSDSDSLDASGRRIEPFFKPDWNYDLLLGQNYVNHLTVYRTQRLVDTGGWREGFEGSQDYDVLLRVVEGLEDSQIAHVPEILYHWRQVPTSVSRGNLGAAVRAARNAIREHLQRTGRAAAVKPCTGALLYSRIEWPAAVDAAAIAVYGTDPVSIDRTRQRLLQLDAALHVDGLLLDAGTRNFPLLNAWAARQQTGVLGFVAAGFEFRTAAAVCALLGHAARPQVAAASAKLISSRGKPRGPLLIEPAGDGRRRVAAAYAAAQCVDDAGYFAGLLLDRRAGALQAGCLCARADAFRAVGGWTRDPGDSLAGIELSLRLRADGGQLIWCAQAAAFSTDAALDDAIAHAPVLVDAPGATDPNANKNLAQ